MANNSKNSLLINGLLYIGGLLSLNFVLSTFQFPMSGLISWLITAFTVFTLYKLGVSYRENICEGYLSFGAAFVFLFQIYIYGAVIQSLILFVYSSFINADYLLILMDNIMELYENMKIDIPKEWYSLLESIYRPLPYALLQLSGSVIAAAFWSLTVSLIVKKPKPMFP
jgi:hypothetical protein